MNLWMGWTAVSGHVEGWGKLGSPPTFPDISTAERTTDGAFSVDGNSSACRMRLPSRACCVLRPTVAWVNNRLLRCGPDRRESVRQARQQHRCGLQWPSQRLSESAAVFLTYSGNGLTNYVDRDRGVDARVGAPRPRACDRRCAPWADAPMPLSSSDFPASLMAMTMSAAVTEPNQLARVMRLHRQRDLARPPMRS